MSPFDDACPRCPRCGQPRPGEIDAEDGYTETLCAPCEDICFAEFG